MFTRILQLAGILTEEMSPRDAARVFQFYGVDEPEKLSAADLKLAWKRLAMRHHVDRGGKPGAMQEINAAYDVLKASAPATSQQKPSAGSAGASSGYQKYEYQPFGDKDRKPKPQPTGKPQPYVYQPFNKTGQNFDKRV